LQKLAILMGSTKTHLSLIERGLVQPQGITQERIAEALGVPREELFPAVSEEATA
jgi:transcriptional regulator with XRE-family HTH domain